MSDKPKTKRKGRPHNAMTMAWLRDRGWTVGKTEQWNPHVRIRQDLFGFIDAIAVKEGEVRAIATQSCSLNRNADHIRKIRGSTSFLTVQCAMYVCVFAWRKLANGRVEPLVTIVGADKDYVLSNANFDCMFGARIQKPKKHEVDE